MAFSIRRLFSNLFLSVVIENSECLFYGRVFKNGKVIKTLNAKFTDVDPQNLDDKILEYIRRQEHTYYAVYVSVFYNDAFQGALPTLRQDEFEKFNIRSDGVISINMSNSFSIYADAFEINKAKDMFGKDSVDLLYSPIALLYSELLKRGISDKTTLYLYNHRDNSALAIFSKKQLKFATFFKVDKTEKAPITEIFKEEDITDIDNLIIKDEDELNSLDDFKSLDEMLNTEKPKDEFEDLGYDINMPASSDVAVSVTIFGRDMNLFKYICFAIKEYYQNPMYQGDFVEQVVIFDNSKTSATFLQYLQTELLVETDVYPIDTLHIMNELMTQEIKI
ncbi:hypothetical protein [Campylobacter mucosalis]|uniref:hypothetical protein n=1 Tax=Campylobacter mucosalis TaxID=202 RepID=UPI0014701707|nr:hypothetical protein [Campylobacter mucosalis]